MWCNSLSKGHASNIPKAPTLSGPFPKRQRCFQVQWRFQGHSQSANVVFKYSGGIRVIPKAPTLFPSAVAVLGSKYFIIEPTTTWRIKIYTFKLAHGHNRKVCRYTGMRRKTTFRSTTDSIYDSGLIILKYYNVIILTTVLQFPTVFSTVTCCTGLYPSSNRLYRIA